MDLTATTSERRVCASTRRGSTLSGQGVGGVSGLYTARKCVRDSCHILPLMSRRWRYHRSSWIEREPRPSSECATLPSCGVQLGCVRGLEAAASLVRRAKVWVTPPTCASRCGHVAGTIIYLQYGGNHVPAPRRFDFVVLDAVSGQCGGRGLRVVAASKRRAIACLTPFACYTRCLDVWAPTVVLGSHSNHVRAPSLRLPLVQGVVRH